MHFVGHIDRFDGLLPTMTFRWDAETEILAGALRGVSGDGGYTGAIELEDPSGALITLDVRDGTLATFEVVVWPELEVVSSLAVPAPVSQCRLVVPPRPSQPGIAFTETESTITGRRTSDDATLYFRVGPARPHEPMQLADKLIVEVDRAGHPAGFWLLDVPPFPQHAGG